MHCWPMRIGTILAVLMILGTPMTQIEWGGGEAPCWGVNTGEPRWIQYLTSCHPLFKTKSVTLNFIPRRPSSWLKHKYALYNPGSSWKSTQMLLSPKEWTSLVRTGAGAAFSQNLQNLETGQLARLGRDSTSGHLQGKHSIKIFSTESVAPKK